jgi:hypothetical protein
MKVGDLIRFNNTGTVCIVTKTFIQGGVRSPQRKFVEICGKHPDTRETFIQSYPADSISESSKVINESR